MSGEIGILNVGAGDTKLIFDRSNPAEMIRAARIVRDMLRRGYALLIEVEESGQKVYRRVYEFREDTCEYVIADLDPVEAEKFYANEGEHHEKNQPAEDAGDAPSGEARKSQPARGRGRTRTVDAAGARGIAVARTAGG